MTEKFIEKAIEKHGDKFDYSLAEYINAKTEVKIICKIHGEFEQTPKNHLRGNGCSGCKNNIKKPESDFIDELKHIHCDKYDYSMVKYTRNCNTIKIICPIHGLFEQKASSHLKGYGCEKCSRAARTKTTIKFIEEAKEIHGDKYDYSSLEYKGSNRKVKIICKTHGEFEQKADTHLDGHGCRKCYDMGRTKTTEEFINKAKEIHGDKYDYSNVIYTDYLNKIKIICKIHGEFEQDPCGHLQGQNCKLCSFLNRSKTTEKFIKDAMNIHGDRYDYSLTEYKGAKIKVCIICDTHGQFEQEPSNHLEGNGCPFCKNKTEGLVYQWLQKTYPNITIIPQCTFEDLLGHRFDFYLDELDLILEVDGDQHFRQVSNWQSPEEQQIRDITKMKFCIENGLSVIRILQRDIANNNYDWKSELKLYLRKYKKPIVKMLAKAEDDDYKVFAYFKKYNVTCRRVSSENKIIISLENIAKLGNFTAMLKLAHIYYNGIEVVKDIDKAKKYWLDAYKHGSHVAAAKLLEYFSYDATDKSQN
jgi:very-short-patch-repair endonuclease